jgi:probable F420-dependent oxidoreductase
MPAEFKVGYQIHPQHCTVQDILAAARALDGLGVDSIWVWDHMFPLYGDPEGSHYECVSLLAAIAAQTRDARLGALVASVTYRNPELYAYTMATIDQISGGRAILGIGAGWNQRDHDEYGYEFGDAPYRLRELGKALPRMKARLEKLKPPPIGELPIMIGGGGERVTLRLVARYADMWNHFPPTSAWARKNAILDEWCAKVGRDPREIERTCTLKPEDYHELDGLVEAGCQHVILDGPAPFSMQPVQELLKLAGR